ncbi:hypothetical protein SASPL_127031 [Salvia splendens]|uniref:Replication protein A 70 kDa DNA-binding subunit B/D first OB fold domain-containing protein n=1 Tax=Salvia splendens TaxID=180675 RepID=A0A8X8ZRD1_SALSN|nr:hypothetical protein SASPL_127031 [Salvia splendens]
MEPFHTLLDDLQLMKTNSIINVRCIHVYEVAAPRDRTNIVSLKCVLHDRMGTRIQATIHARFGALIREGGIFRIRNFLARQNRPRNPVTNHAYHIKMILSTQMIEVNEPQFPKMLFNLKSFEEIMQIGNVCDEPLFDIIGVVVDTGKIVTHSTSRLIEIRLSDSEISGDVAFLSQESIYRFTETRVSNEFDGLVVKTLADVQEDVDGSYWICGRIENVECHYGQWSYKTCKQCVKKVVKIKNGFNSKETIDCAAIGSVTMDGDAFAGAENWSAFAADTREADGQRACSGSRDGMAATNPRSRAGLGLAAEGTCPAGRRRHGPAAMSEQRRIGYEWEAVGQRRIDTAAANLCKLAVRTDNRHSCLGANEYIPPEIEEKLLGQTLLFRIHVKNSNEYWIDKSYTVNKICNDPQIVEKYIPPTLDSRGSNSGLEISPTLEGLSPFAGTDVVLHGSTSSTNDTHTKLIAKDSLKRSLDVEILGQTIVVGGEQKKLMIKQEKN